MVCQALMRHLIGSDQRLKRVTNDPRLNQKYRFILNLINDNDDTHKGAFSIQNVAKIGLCHKKLPGEWYGPHAISTMLKDLNKVY